MWMDLNIINQVEFKAEGEKGILDDAMTFELGR
jgi:hypothetical protein